MGSTQKKCDWYERKLTNLNLDMGMNGMIRVVSGKDTARIAIKPSTSQRKRNMNNLFVKTLNILTMT